MSKRKLNFEDNKYNYYIKEFTEPEITDINIYSKILSNKSSFYITNENHSKIIQINELSLKNILLKIQQEPYEYILFTFYNDNLPSQSNDNEKPKNKNKLRGAKKPKQKEKIKEKEIEKEKEKENEDVILNVSSPERLIKEEEKQNESINNIYLNNYTRKNENPYNAELGLLNIKSNENLIKTDNLQDKYLLLLYNDKIKITNQVIKCFYLILLFCGLIYGFIFVDALIDKNKTVTCLFYISCFPLSFLLIITGLYGYYKINAKIYDDNICIFLTYSCIIAPFLNFIFSLISSEENVRKNIMNILINFITIIFAGICAYILNELKNKKNKNGLLFEKINIV